ncbi:Cell division protein DedD (plasmid) [Caballeronia sp. SBC1]|uniref:SPOR domain-containing protein n=1 Tax=unclassified Caballeronia TaxID=2646786 RepID=UPI0013E1A91E|nr:MULTISPECIES: SPOR domain-containing protein [unclassified Caballeronia]QIE27563.1 Cell division protein DedD [Caballeronia sp. SBC2]QIN65629.1 Cell division protein DedD [Caballeronia sp. SBC1]
MSFFSFGKKDDAPSGRDTYSDSPRGSRQTVRTERRTRRSDRPEADAMMLDPTLPEKQRARRRLVGALALVAAAVIILPMVLDSHPKPVTDDISIDIPARPAAPLPKTSHNDATDAGAVDSSADTQAGVAPDGPAAATDNAAAVASKPALKPDSKQASKPVETQTQAKAAEAQPEAKPAAPPSAVTNAQASKPAAQAPAPVTAATPKPNTPASPAGSRFVVQIGTFDDDTAAQGWVTKLKAAGVPAYIEHRKQADGTTRTLLRAGPFADRTAASAALVKVRQAGLGGGNGGSNSASAN